MRAMKRILALASFLVLVGVSRVPSASLGTGSNTCPSSGAKQLSSTQRKVTWISIQSPSTNVGILYVGGASVASTQGNAVLPLGTSFLPPVSNSAAYDLSQTFFTCSNSADTVIYTYAQ